LIQVQGYSATAAGASMLPFILLMFFLSRWSGGLVDRYGARRPLVIGPVIVALGFLIFAVPSIGGTYWTTYFPAVVVLGLGMAISVAPLTTTVMNSVPQARAGTASGINNAVSRLAGVLSIAALGIVMLTTFNRHLSGELAAADLSPPIRQQIESERANLAAIEIPQLLDSRSREEIRRAVDESFIAGFRLVMLIAAALALLSSAIARLLVEDRPKQ
jgi:MFS family permease